MKRLALVAAVLAVAACSKKETPATDTATPAMAPAPAPAAMDTGMKMDTTKMDSTMMKKRADSLHQDSVTKGLIPKKDTKAKKP
jgi:hypothetical protein